MRKRETTTQEVREKCAPDLNTTERVPKIKAGWIREYIDRLETRIVLLNRDLDTAAAGASATEPNVSIEGQYSIDPVIGRYPIETRILFNVNPKRTVFEVRYFEEAEGGPYMYFWSTRGLILRPGGGCNSLKIWAEK